MNAIRSSETSPRAGSFIYVGCRGLGANGGGRAPGQTRMVHAAGVRITPTATRFLLLFLLSIFTLQVVAVVVIVQVSRAMGARLGLAGHGIQALPPAGVGEMGHGVNQL
eukprot:765649-Hanusia_phi.AAC.3